MDFKSSTFSETTGDMFGYMRRLEAITVDFHHERDIIMVLGNFSLEVVKSKYNEAEIKLMVYYLLGFSYNRLSTVQEAVKECLATILLRFRKMMFILYNSFMMKNLSHLKENYLTDIKEEDEIVEDKLSSCWFSVRRL